jgi:glycosyltransferase involved in cell wall biosynthesis
MSKATVLMPVYNGASYLREAIDSILAQTFVDFEFLIVNDGSTDNSNALIDAYRDPRIRHLQMKTNGGIVKALNHGLENAQGELVVRMDADDIALPHRLQRLVEFMDAHSDVGVCGSWVEYFGNKAGIVKTAVTHNEIIWNLTSGSPLFHPTVAIRSEVLKRHQLKYSETVLHAEDYDLWERMSWVSKFSNVPEVLLKYRITNSSVSAVYRDVQQRSTSIINRRIHEGLSGQRLTDQQWASLDISSEKPLDVRDAVRVYTLINQRNDLFSESEFKSKLAFRLKKIMLKKGTDLGSKLWLFRNSFRDISFAKYIFRQAADQ